MAHGKRDGFGYLDGVPIKIHEKCNAPRKVTLPISFHYCSSSALVNAETLQSALPDPYDELTTEQQQIVLTIEEMGFPRGQVARAVKHLGEDSKKIIEHLCQVQKLIETGHNDIDAEVALHINEYKIEEATKFLDLQEQLKGLGFEKNAITRALVQHKNDRDKALDALLS